MSSSASSTSMLSLVACALASLPGAAACQTVAGPGAPRRAAGAAANVSLRDAIAAALRARPGRAVEAELEDALERGRSDSYEVIVVTDAHELFEVKVDPATGAVRETSKEEDGESQQELREFEAILRQSRLELAELVGRCETVVKGEAVRAMLDAGDGPECDVFLRNGSDVFELRVDARAGRLLAIELKSAGAPDAAVARAVSGGGERALAKTRPPGASPAAAAPPRPLAAGVRFSPRITHPYLPLSTVRYAELRSADERVVREVQDATKAVGGVECLVLAEKEYEDGELAEISYNYFAQDADGNVWYFGEDVDDYEDGQVVAHGGAWKVGRNTAEPCLFLPARLEVGFRFKPEDCPPAAEEWDEIADTNATLSVSGLVFRDVLVVSEGDRPDRATERKYYARGIGLVSENGTLNLASLERSGSKPARKPRRTY